MIRNKLSSPLKCLQFSRSRETPSPVQANDRGAKADSGYLSKAGLATPTLMASTGVDSPTNISILRGSF